MADLANPHDGTYSVFAAMNLPNADALRRNASRRGFIRSALQRRKLPNHAISSHFGVSDAETTALLAGDTFRSSVSRLFRMLGFDVSVHVSKAGHQPQREFAVIEAA